MLLKEAMEGAAAHETDFGQLLDGAGLLQIAFHIADGRGQGFFLGIILHQGKIGGNGVENFIQEGFG